MADLIPTKEELQKAFEERHGKELQKLFADAVVAVCGLGGLGSNIAVSLERAGIGKLIIADFDKVDITNLHRQQYKANQIGEYKANALKQNLQEISPYIEIEEHITKITEENISDIVGEADIICEAFDKASEKSVLVNAVSEKYPDKYLVAASGMAGIGSPNLITTRRVTKHFYLCGDGVSDVDSTNGLFAPRVMLCAAHQAQTVLRILANAE